MEGFWDFVRVLLQEGIFECCKLVNGGEILVRKWIGGEDLLEGEGVEWIGDYWEGKEGGFGSLD